MHMYKHVGNLYVSYSAVEKILSRNFLHKVTPAMDIVSQLQEQVDMHTHLASNTVGTLQRDAPLLISSRQITLRKNGDTFSLIAR
jgi:hypothetical protein